MVLGIGILLGLAARATGFDVIGAGVRHTGCDELAEALDILGIKTYHSGRELPNTHPEWVQLTEQTSRYDTAAALAPLYDLSKRLVKEGYKAIVSSPAAFYTLELLRKYPKAKVILTVHENARTWFWEAQKGTQIALHRDMVKAEYNRLEGCPLPPADADIPECTAAYETHNNMMREYVPPKQFHEFKAADGWGPLCKFLGVPVPRAPFPGGKKSAGTSEWVIWGVGFAILLIGLLVAAVFMGTSSPSPSKKSSKKKAKD